MLSMFSVLSVSVQAEFVFDKTATWRSVVSDKTTAGKGIALDKAIFYYGRWVTLYHYWFRHRVVFAHEHSFNFLVT
jgi:hypothetical protein